MNQRKPPSIEPERYELEEPTPYRFRFARREFFQFSGSGLLVLLASRTGLAIQESGRANRSSDDVPTEIEAWLHIAGDGKITVYTGKVEVGQNIRTSLAQAVAEELHCRLESIALVMGDTDLTPYDRGTFGSLSTPSMAPQLRRMAGAARETIQEMAAARWEVPADSVEVEDGKARHFKTGRSIGFGELTEGKPLTRQVASDPPLTPPEKWRIAGRSAHKVDGETFVTGKHDFTSDLSLPGMLHGKIIRPPAINSTLASADLSAARQMKDVTAVHESDFLGVAAHSAALADEAANKIKTQWTPSSGQPSSDEIYAYLKAHPREARGWGGRSNHSAGSVEAAFKAADHVLEQSYRVAYIAHAPLEPRAAVAQWKQGRLTVWTGTQRPFGVRSELAEAFHLPEEKIRVIVPDTGSGYGGKHTGECAIEAARLAKAAGKPVKLVWTREEEFTWAYFRPAGVIDVKSGVNKDGLLSAWEFHNYNSGGSAIRTPYHVENQKIEFHPADSPLRQGSYRALAATANHFARETHMDELARLVGVDPLQFRLRNLKDDRLKAVLNAAAKTFGWGKKGAGKQAGAGIACGFEKGGYVAACAEVTIEAARQVKIVRVAAAFECGAVVNPDHLKSQVEGALVQGIGGALFEAIQFNDGRIANGRFSSYRVPRFSDVPRLDVTLVDRRDLPSAGAGETPIVALAPAVGNAIFDATGIRLRSLPLAPNGVEKP